MSFLLDMKTIFITLVIGHLFAVIIISAYWRNHKKDTILNSFFLAKCIQASAWLLLTIQGGISDIFTISISNSLLFIGSALESVALLKLKDFYNKTTKKYYLFSTIASIAVFHVIILVNNLENLRIAVASIGSVALIIIPAYRLITESGSTLLSKIMGYTYLFVIVSFVIRTLTALLTKEPMGFFTPGINQTLSFLGLYLVMTFGNIGFVLLLKENTDEELLRLASYDDLTKTLNRRTFILKAEELIHMYAKKQQPVSFILFDIDYFKEVNDKFGHVMGDRVLQHMCKRISTLINDDNLFGRYGGDEFAILLPRKAQSQAVEFAEQVRMSVIDEMSSQKLPTSTLSIGVTTVIPNQFTKLEELYSMSDKAMYFAKKNGRNCVICDVLDGNNQEAYI